MVAETGGRGIEVHPCQTSLREPRRDQLLELLGADAVGALHRVAAVGALRRDRKVAAAIVTPKPRRHPVQGERDGTVGALRHLAALRTLDERGVAPSIEQQDRLLAPYEDCIQR